MEAIAVLLIRVVSVLSDFIILIAKWALTAFVWVLGKTLFYPFDGLLTCISSIFNAINLSTFVASYAMNWAGLPTQMIWLINAVAIPQGISILLAAITIRMLINLIPAAFTRI